MLPWVTERSLGIWDGTLAIRLPEAHLANHLGFECVRFSHLYNQKAHQGQFFNSIVLL